LSALPECAVGFVFSLKIFTCDLRLMGT
jgi:hypothetical protein